MSDEFQLRWRGKVTGPFPIRKIRGLLDSNRIGVMHEILVDGRWKTLREFLEHGDSHGLRSSSTVSTCRDGLEFPGFRLRWRGVETGPFTLAQIESQIDRQEVGNLHEVFAGGDWVTISDFLREAAAASRAQPSSGGRGGSSISGGRGGSSMSGYRVVASNLTKEVSVSGGAKRLLNDVSFAVESGEFVAILGPSGSGKSTLMDAINGRRPAPSGTVHLNGLDLIADFDQLRRSMGYVPQKDILHLPLTVRQELVFAAKLRLHDESGEERNQRIWSVVEKLGLEDQLETRNANLSGGQLKRVSVAVELLSEPKVLFLDEATSGLDSCTEARLMHLFRQMANDGCTVICITHNLENLAMCDKALVLCEGMKVFYGSPEEMCSHFNVDSYSAIYDRMIEQPAVAWAMQQEQRECQIGDEEGHLVMSPKSVSGRELRDLLTLVNRYLSITVQDHRNLILMLMQAPVIALLLVAVFGEQEQQSSGQRNQTTLVFLMSVSAIWFGCINSAREITKELAIYRRERMIGLGILPYFFSKVCVLIILSLIQCACLVGIISAMVNYELAVGQLFLTTWATACSAVTLGLLVSALCETPDKAVSIIPILLIPQVIFAGAIKSLSGWSEVLAQWAIAAYWSFDASLHSIHPGSLARYSLTESVINILLFMALFGAGGCYALRLKDEAS